MQARLDAYRTAPDDINAVLALESHVKASGLEKSLIELVKIRASQINGCAYCLEMHTREARAAGEAEERIHLLSAWRESSFFSERERAALGWTEVLTLVAETHAPDGDYAEVEKNFSPSETVSLTLLIGTINLWNRIAVGFRTQHPSRKFPT